MFASEPKSSRSTDLHLMNLGYLFPLPDHKGSTRACGSQPIKQNKGNQIGKVVLHTYLLVIHHDYPYTSKSMNSTQFSTQSLSLRGTTKLKSLQTLVWHNCIMPFFKFKDSYISFSTMS